MSESDQLTPVQARILKFFHDNPQAVESLRGIATWLGDVRDIGEDVRTLEEALLSLVARGWLATHETTAVTAFSLTREERSLSQIREALKGLL